MVNPSLEPGPDTTPEKPVETSTTNTEKIGQPPIMPLGPEICEKPSKNQSEFIVYTRKDPNSRKKNFILKQCPESYPRSDQNPITPPNE